MHVDEPIWVYNNSGPWNWLISKVCIKVNYIRHWFGHDQQFPRTGGQSSSMFHHHIKNIQNFNMLSLQSSPHIPRWASLNIPLCSVVVWEQRTGSVPLCRHTNGYHRAAAEASEQSASLQVEIWESCSLGCRNPEIRPSALPQNVDHVWLTLKTQISLKG